MMTFKDAKKLHNEDEVIHKGTGAILYVVKTSNYEKNIFILCDDGITYHHRELC